MISADVIYLNSLGLCSEGNTANRLKGGGAVGVAAVDDLDVKCHALLNTRSV